MSNFELMKLNNINLTYFTGLFEKKQRSEKSRRYWIFERGKTAPDLCETVYPTAIIDGNDELKLKFAKDLKIINYAEILNSKKNYSRYASQAAIWLRRLQAGTGSSLTRPPLPGRKVGAKGTDLIIEVDGKEVSLAEAQMIRAIYDLERGAFGEIFFHDLVSSETRSSIGEMWSKKSFVNPTVSYLDHVKNADGLSRFGETEQQHVWTLDELNNLSANRTAPAGHGLFAQDALRAALGKKPETAKTVIALLGNGEDLGTPDEHMVGYMIAEKIPIAMITTEKTVADGKGGVLAVVDSSPRYLTVLETAQAEAAGQLELFRNLKGEANTNLVLINYDVLTPLLEKFIAERGLQEFEASIVPDLIQNWKTQLDADGVQRKYLQIEGATGSVLMNLDRKWREIYGEPLIHIISVPLKFRASFFSPVKTAFDFFMQFYSDRFKLIHDRNKKIFRLENLRGDLPEILLTDQKSQNQFYQDLTTVLNAFKNTSIVDLDSLCIEGKVDLSGTVLKGQIQIQNLTDSTITARTLVEKMHAPHEILNGKIIFNNLKITIQTRGGVQS